MSRYFILVHGSLVVTFLPPNSALEQRNLEFKNGNGKRLIGALE